MFKYEVNLGLVIELWEKVSQINYFKNIILNKIIKVVELEASDVTQRSYSTDLKYKNEKLYNSEWYNNCERKV